MIVETGRTRQRRLLWFIGPVITEREYLESVFTGARWQNPYNMNSWPVRVVWRRDSPIARSHRGSVPEPPCGGAHLVENNSTKWHVVL
jgi:hypothetical protein